MRTDVAMRRPRVLVVGDAMVDRYHTGTARRLSPEAPIPVVKIVRTFDLPGGAGNVKANLESLGCEVVLEGGEGTPVKNRLMVGDQQIARWDEEDQVQPAKLAYYIDTKDTNILRIDAVVVADYAKGAVVLSDLRRLHQSHPTIPFFIDTKRSPREFEGIPATFFPNNVEYEQFRDVYVSLPNVVWKKGSKGMTEYGPNSVRNVCARKVTVRSVNGAGDTVLAAYVYATLCAPADPLEFANAAAALAVAQPYTSTVTVRGVKTLLGLVPVRFK